MTTHLETFEDYRITASAPEDYRVDFDVRRVSGPVQEEGRFLTGFIRWDACSNWHFDPDEQVCLHLCGREAAAGVGRLLERLYAIAEELIDAGNR